jgi:hypothetical protein
LRIAAKALYMAALSCYTASFFLPAFGIGTQGQVEVHDGAEAFLVSLMAPSWPLPGTGGLTALVVWLANPAFWAGAVFFVRGHHGRALATSCGALILGCWHALAPLVLVGYYVWLVSFSLLTLSCVVRLLPGQVAMAEPPATLVL